MDPILEKNVVYIYHTKLEYIPKQPGIYTVLSFFIKQCCYICTKIRLLILRRLRLYIQHRIQRLTVKEKSLKDDGRT